MGTVIFCVVISKAFVLVAKAPSVYEMSDLYVCVCVCVELENVKCMYTQHQGILNGCWSVFMFVLCTCGWFQYIAFCDMALL